MTKDNSRIPQRPGGGRVITTDSDDTALNRKGKTETFNDEAPQSITQSLRTPKRPTGNGGTPTKE
ncbi:hypothetical protein [Vibrio paucivorans]